MYAPQPTFIPAKGLSQTVGVRTSYPQPTRPVNGTPFIPTRQTIQEQVTEQKQRVFRELLAAGVRPGVLRFGEARILPTILHPDEHVKAVVFGYYQGSLAMLVATDSRVLFLDKKPMFMLSDELTFDIVGGVTYSRSWLVASFTLHSKIGDFSLKTVNFKAAEKFKSFIEQRCLEHPTVGRYALSRATPVWP